MEIISGYVETLKRNEFIKLALIDCYSIGQALADERWYLFASIGMRSFALSVHATEAEASDARDIFLIELTPEMERSNVT